MVNFIIGFPNHVDADPAYASVSFSNGNWTSQQPLTNLKRDLLSVVARSADALETSTVFDVDLGMTRDARIVSIPKHSIERSGLIRILASTEPDFSDEALNTGWQEVWKSIYNLGDLYLGHPSFLDGKLSAEESVGYPMPYNYIHESPILARYWRVEVKDPTNSKGYVQLNRLFICPGWQSGRNFSYTNQIGWEDDSDVVRSLGGARFFKERPKRRVIRFNVSNLDRDEAFSWPFEIMRRQGLTKQVMVILNPDDGIHLHRTSFVANLRQLSPLENPYHNKYSTGFELEEVIA